MKREDEIKKLVNLILDACDTAIETLADLDPDEPLTLEINLSQETDEPTEKMTVKIVVNGEQL